MILVTFNTAISQFHFHILTFSCSHEKNCLKIINDNSTNRIPEHCKRALGNDLG